MDEGLAWRPNVVTATRRMLKDALHSWVVFLEASGLVDARRRAGKLWAVWRNTLSIEVTECDQLVPARDVVSLDQTVSLASRSLSAVGVVLELAVQQCCGLC